MRIKKSAVIKQFTISTPSIKEKWDIKKAKLRKKYPTLTESDLKYDEGKRGVMWEKLQLKLKLSKEELQKLISES